MKKFLFVLAAFGVLAQPAFAETAWAKVAYPGCRAGFFGRRQIVFWACKGVAR